jgi:hypothetical protein
MGSLLCAHCPDKDGFRIVDVLVLATLRAEILGDASNEIMLPLAQSAVLAKGVRVHSR